MKVGLVLSGGGARGAYEVGVIKALTEAGIKFDVIAGTSVGGLNAILVSSGQIDDLVNLWERLTNKDVYLHNVNFTLKVSEILMLFLPIISIFWLKRFIKNKLESLDRFKSIKNALPLRNLISRTVDFDKLFKSKNTLILTGTNLQLGTEDLFIKTDTGKLFINDIEVKCAFKNILKDMAMATCAIPIIFSPQIVANYQYVDGGVGNNVPLLPVIKQGCDIIFTIILSPENFAVNKTFDTISSIGSRSFSILYENTMREDLKRSELVNLIASKVKTKNFKSIKHIVIRPAKRIDIDLLEFNPMKSKMYIQQGYEDTLESLNTIKDKEVLNLFRSKF